MREPAFDFFGLPIYSASCDVAASAAGIGFGAPARRRRSRAPSQRGQPAASGQAIEDQRAVGELDDRGDALRHQSRDGGGDSLQAGPTSSGIFSGWRGSCHPLPYGGAALVNELAGLIVFMRISM
jgi:hypothetical protein